MGLAGKPGTSWQGATDPGGRWPSGRRASPVGRRRLEDEQELLGKAGVNGTTGPAHGCSAPRPRGSMAWVSSSTEGGRPDAAAPDGHHDDQPAGAGHRGRPAAAKSRVAQPPSPAGVKGAGTPANQERPAGRRRLWSCWLPLGTHSRRETQQPIPAEVGAEVDEGESGGLRWARGAGGASGLAGLSSPSAATPCPHLPFWPQTHPGFPFSGPWPEEPSNASFCPPAASSGKSSQMTCAPVEQSLSQLWAPPACDVLKAGPDLRPCPQCPAQPRSAGLPDQTQIPQMSNVKVTRPRPQACKRQNGT